jgi:hypothetical protein
MARPGFIIKCPTGDVSDASIVYRDEKGIETPINAVTKLQITMNPADRVMVEMEAEVIEMEVEVAADCTHVKAHPEFRNREQQIHDYCVKRGYTTDTLEQAQAKLADSVTLGKDDRSGPCRCEDDTKEYFPGPVALESVTYQMESGTMVKLQDSNVTEIRKVDYTKKPGDDLPVSVPSSAYYYGKPRQ